MKKLLHVLSSNKFLYVIIGLFVFQALWIALSNIYPLPFDEHFHIGIIDIYAQQWSPFISEQGPAASLYGDITRLPSYLYHYLMSFPHRLVTLFIHDFTWQVIALRLINIAFVAIGLVWFRKVLLQLGLSKLKAHVALLFFVLVPLVPMLAAQVNYDNLLIMLLPMTFYLAIKIIQSKQLQIKDVILLVCLGALTSLIKFTFLPVLVPLTFYVVYVLFRRHGKDLWQVIKHSWKGLSATTKYGLVILLLVSLGLFIERHIVNTLHYGTPNPACDQIQPVEVCSDWTVYQRNQRYQAEFAADPGRRLEDPLGFSEIWFPKMITDSLLAFTHVDIGNVQMREWGPIVTKREAPVVKAAAMTFFWIGMALILICIKRFRRQDKWRLVILAIAFYVVALWVKNYTGYLNAGQIVAVQSRYMLPLLPLLFALMIQAFDWVLKQKAQKTAVLLVALLAMSQGGGLLIYIIRSEPNWYWQNKTVLQVNQAAKKIVKPLIIIEGDHTDR